MVKQQKRFPVHNFGGTTGLSNSSGREEESQGGRAKCVSRKYGGFAAQRWQAADRPAGRQTGSQIGKKAGGQPHPGPMHGGAKSLYLLTQLTQHAARSTRSSQIIPSLEGAIITSSIKRRTSDPAKGPATRNKMRFQLFAICMSEKSILLIPSLILLLIPLPIVYFHFPIVLQRTTQQKVELSSIVYYLLDITTRLTPAMFKSIL